jgi:AcrR family transcriptional regulator
MSNSLPTGKQGVPQHPHGSAKPKAEPVDITVKTSRGQQREAEILNAAREVFLEKGFERASVSEIAARVGVVEGNVFRYFPTKRDLLNEVLAALYKPLIADVAAGFARIAGVRARLRFIVWRHIRVYTEMPGLARLVLHEVRTAPDYPTSVLHELQLRYTDFLRQALEQAVADGEVPADVDYEMVRSMLYGGLEHMMWPVLFGHSKVDVERIAERFTEAILHGIQRRATSSSIEARLERLERLMTASSDRQRPGKRRIREK